MLGHEITALHGLDHAQTLAVVLPALLQAKRQQKHAKLLQYAERVWDLRSGSEAERIDGAIAATRDFFERMGIKTRLRDYGVADAGIDTLLGKLAEHGMTAIGEHGDIDLVQSQHIYEAAW